MNSRNSQSHLHYAASSLGRRRHEGKRYTVDGFEEPRRAWTPDVYRLCAGQIPNVKAIIACLHWQKANLAAACATVFEQ